MKLVDAKCMLHVTFLRYCAFKLQMALEALEAHDKFKETERKPFYSSKIIFIFPMRELW